MAKIQSGSAVDLMVFSQAEAKVGDFKWSALDEISFSGEHLGLWKLCNGQTCSGTAYATMTGKTTVPNALTDGSFIRQAKAGRDLLTTEGDAIRNITGKTGNGSYGFLTSGSSTDTGALYQVKRTDGSFSGSGIDKTCDIYLDASRVVPTADENRPKNIALNLYVKVGY